MKEPDVSGWSREELETAYKQMAKNCAARGQSLAYAQKQIEGMKQDAKQIIEEVREYLQKIGLLEKLAEYRLQMIAMYVKTLREKDREDENDV